MDKAIEKIEWLQDVFVTRKEEQHFDVDVTIKDAFKEALSELQAYKAEIYELKQYNSSQMCKKCAYKDANDNLKALYCNSCFRNYVDNFEELYK